ncbi:MAG: ribulose-phosphate 3-epimerase [Alistipes sp.]|nr:ribulose-phosphate 3-epimerase [Alistipes sp.]
MSIIVAPSMLSANFGNLDKDVEMVNQSEAGWFHLDIMDGVFVPNISFGFPVMKPIRKATSKVLDVHLMIVRPELYIKRFADAGADYVTFHYEATEQIDECIRIAREAGVKVGISIKPATSVDVLKEILPKVDLVLVMSVEPGFGGQSFMPDSLDKVRELAAIKREQGLDYIIEIDGGISAKNAGEVFAAGAETLVAGSAVFGAADPKAEIEKMLNA